MKGAGGDSSSSASRISRTCAGLDGFRRCSLRGRRSRRRPDIRPGRPVRVPRSRLSDTPVALVMSSKPSIGIVPATWAAQAAGRRGRRSPRDSWLLLAAARERMIPALGMPPFPPIVPAIQPPLHQDYVHSLFWSSLCSKRRRRQGGRGRGRRHRGFTHLETEAANPFPSFAGEGGPKGRMGCGKQVSLCAGSR